MRKLLVVALLGAFIASPTTASTDTVSQLPGMLSGQHAWNGTSFTQNLWTHEGTQYAVWVDDQRHPIVGSRLLPDGDWETFDLANVSGNPLESPMALDNHNVLAVGVDPSGHIHVAGNMHGSNPIRYVRSVNPGDITAWEDPGMVGDETRVTYPQFVLSGGELLFFYRQGGSQTAHIYVNAYQPGTKSGELYPVLPLEVSSHKWVRRAHLFDGEATGETPYLNRVGVADDGTLHVLMVWRSVQSDPTTHNDISYVRSVDGGRTWADSNGEQYGLPITHDTVEVALDTPAQGSGLLNQSGLAVDEAGNPHGAYLLNDHLDSTQVYHVWHDGSVWRKEQVTNLTLSLDLTNYGEDRFVSRPSVFYDGDVWVLYWAGDDDTDAKPLHAVNITTGETRTVLDGGLGDWEPTYDPQAPDGELHMLVTEVASDGAGPTSTSGAVVALRLDG